MFGVVTSLVQHQYCARPGEMSCNTKSNTGIMQSLLFVVHRVVSQVRLIAHSPLNNFLQKYCLLRHGRSQEN